MWYNICFILGALLLISWWLLSSLSVFYYTQDSSTWTTSALETSITIMIRIWPSIPEQRELLYPIYRMYHYRCWCSVHMDVDSNRMRGNSLRGRSLFTDCVLPRFWRIRNKLPRLSKSKYLITKTKHPSHFPFFH